MYRHVTSKDPRKPAICWHLKKASGGSKVTLLTETSPNVFRAHCMKPDGRLWKSVGYWEADFGRGENVAFTEDAPVLTRFLGDIV